MMLLRLVNPPAGATALVAYGSGAGWWFVAFPVAAGSVALVLFASLYHHVTGGVYPAHPPR
jgi:CBS-domain-containing membrane protein